MRAFFRILVCLLPLAALAAAKREGLGFTPSASNAIEQAASIYIAPENEFLYRMRNPAGAYREFQKSEINSTEDVQTLWSPHGWKGAVREKEGLIFVESGAKVKGGRVVYLFQHGRLVQFEQKGKVQRIPFEMPRPPTAGGAPYYFGDEGEGTGRSDGTAQQSGTPRAQRTMAKEVERELKKKWAKSGRLCWPFENPNENGFLFLSLALLSTALFFCAKPAVRIAGGAGFVAASAALVMTASRGSFLAFAFGLLPAIALNYKKLVRSRAVWILAGIVVLTAVGWFATHESRLLTRGFTKQTKWSNDTRIEMWATAPQMIAEAPKGWGGMHVNPAHMVGRAYVDWYDRLSEISLSGSLVNDHLTRLVGYSQVGRFVYLFVWFGLLALMTYTAVRTKRAVALGVFVALAVAGWFNAVLMNVYLWGAPLAALVLFLIGRPWRVWRLRTVGLLAVGAAALAGATLAGIVAYGRATVKRGYPIYVADGQVRVKEDVPAIWIVDDGKALGGIFACRDIRRHYLRHPSAPAIGYVRHVKDLPAGEMKRLVLAGNAGKEWLERLFKRVKEGEKVAVPEEVVFITPPFMPSELPEELVKMGKMRYVVGEFVARYYSEDGACPKGLDVTVVPGMELYIQDWMRFAVE